MHQFEWIRQKTTMSTLSMTDSSDSSIFKRISNLVLFILCIVVGVNLFFMHTHNAQQWYEVESEQLGRSLTIQAAKLVAAPLAREDQELLGHYVDVINKGMFVTDAVLFNENGIRYAQQEERPTVIDMMTKQGPQPLVFVEDIVFNSETIGYIKLVLDQQEITQHHRNFNENQLTQTLLVVLLSVIIAVLATRFFYKIRNTYKFDEADVI